MRDSFSIGLGKIISWLARLYGGGSALPGLVLEKINSDVVGESLQALPYGVVVISGTNGKTTTTKALTAILRGQGLRVFTNETGSNFMRGVASAWLDAVNRKGEFEADIAVLELDEAHAVKFTEQILPRYAVLLNVMKDQLDRFAELDKVAGLLAKIAHVTTDRVIINADDQYLQAVAEQLPTDKKSYFGWQSPNAKLKLTAGVVGLTNQRAEHQLGKCTLSFTTQLAGEYNQLNLAAAMAAAKVILGNKLDLDRLIDSLEKITPAFGRGEVFKFGANEIRLNLVKNPAGFQASLATAPDKAVLLMALNDNYADGRDTSWIWDVDFSALKPETITTTGSRASELALRLKYDNLSANVETDYRLAIKQLLANPSSQPKVIFASYTAMLKIRHQLIRLQRKYDHN